MIRIAICDNEDKDLEQISQCIQEYFETHRESGGGKLYQFTTGKELLEEMGERQFDVYFLDIIMPEINGLELGRAVREKEQLAPIIYITTSREFAFEAYGVKAMQYLQKPVVKQEVFAILDLLLEYWKKYRSEQISVNTKQGLTNISINDILFVENVSRSAVYSLKDGTRLESICNRGPFEESVKPLSGHPDFVQPHKSFFVNMNYVRTLCTDAFVLDNGQEIAISRKRMAQTKKEYLKFLASGGRSL